MEQENKYYTPDVENIRYGYEMEWLNKANESSFVLDGVDVDTWTKWDYEFQGLSLNGIRNMIADKRLRVPYLTKEQIEELGWEHTGGQLLSHGRQDYEKGNYVLNHWCYSPPRELSMVRIYIKEDPMVMGNYNGIDKILYDGTCKSINELRTIQKLLKIQ